MGLLSGLNGLGLGGLDGMSLYEDNRKSIIEEQEEKEEKAAKQFEESEFLFEKGYKCVACDRDFKVLALKTGKAKLNGTDIDLRPKYDKIEPLKYDVVMCPVCGCAALTRYWGTLSNTQYENVRKEIGKAFVSKKYTSNIYTFDEAVERYQMALANAIVKQSRASEKAYICLKTGWLLRAKAESLDPAMDGYDKEYKATKEQEDEFLKNALEGLIVARRSEHFPICGMDEYTIDYLLAALMVRYKEYDQAAKLVGNLIVSKTSPSRIKDKARILKDEILNQKQM